MQIAQIAQIQIAESRQRKIFDPDKLVELRESIAKTGLLHPPVVRKSGDKLFLVAGERRLRAIKDMEMLRESLRFNGQSVPPGFVPYVTLGELAPLEAEEAELEENAIREDLTWQELTEARARLHRLREKQAEAVGRKHTIADTAEEVHGRGDGYYQQSIRESVILANHLQDPDIAKAKTQAEAFKILKKKDERARMERLSATVGETYGIEKLQLLKGSCLDFMAGADFVERFDVICTDPPYGMGADQFGDAAGRHTSNEHNYKDDYESWIALMRPWTQLSYKVAKAQAHAYVFCDIDRFHELKSMMEEAGWYVFRTPFILFKPDATRVPLPEHGPRRQWEMCLYAIKGKKPVTHIYGDVITATGDPSSIHGARKPVAVYENLLMRSVRPGDSVIDPFAGTGTIFKAAVKFQCECVGIEMSPSSAGICMETLDAIGKELAGGGIQAPTTGGSEGIDADELMKGLGK